MSGLTNSKRRMMSVLMVQAPEEVLEAIVARFKQAGGDLATDVVTLARQELLERAVLSHAFEPVLPLFSPRADGVAAPSFSRSAPKKIWAEIARRRPELTENFTAMIRRDAEAIAPAGLADGILAEAASVVRSVDPATLGLASEAQADDLAGYIDLAPLVRAAGGKVPEWLGRLDGELQTSLRLTFKDADALREDGRARLMELLMTRLPRAAEVLRLIAGLTDQATADFIDRTEMAGFAARLLDHVEKLAARIKLDTPRLDHIQARQAISDLSGVSEVLGEFDLCFPAATGGDWTRRLLAVRRQLTSQLETAYRTMPKAVEKALPLVSIPLAGRMSRMGPDFSADSGSSAVDTARALLEVLAGTRSVAASLGCEGARRAAAEAMSERIDSYAEEALHMLHDRPTVEAERARELIEVAAEFLSLSRSPEAGALIRRRSAVAVAAPEAPGAAAA